MRALWVEQKIASAVDRSKKVGEFKIGLHLRKLAMSVKQISLVKNPW